MRPQLICAVFILLINICKNNVLCMKIIAPNHPHQHPYYGIHRQKGPVYAFILPGKIAKNNDYIITALFDGHDGETNVNISMLTYTNMTNAVYYKLTEKFTGNETKVLKLKIADFMPHTRMHINITGDGNARFSHNGVKLIAESQSDVILLQTDKAMYKPGQTVKIRVVAVDDKLLPINGKQIIIFIRDGKGNIVKRYTDATKNGIVAHQLKLSDEPILGHWRITVNHFVEKTAFHGTDKKFEVAEYVLPTFDLKINVPKVATFQMKQVQVTITATYTFSKQVKADLTLYVEDNSQYDYINNTMVRRKNYELRAKFSGDITVEIPMSALSINQYNYQQSFHLLAVVKDELTGKVYNKTNEMIIYQHPYIFQLINPTRHFTPGLPYAATFKITTRDGLPVANKGPSVKVKYGFGWDERYMTKEVNVVPVNGFFVVDLDTKFTKSVASVFTEKVVKSKKCYIYYRKIYPPKVERNSISIFLNYRNISQNVGSLYKQVKMQMGCWIQIKQHNFALEVPKVNEVINITLNFGAPLNYFIYEIISKKGVIKSEIVKPSGLQHNVSIQLLHSMTPQFRFVAYSLCNGTMISAQFDTPIETRFNDVDITTNVNETKPGSPITITVQTKSKAAIALLAVDKKTLLLKTGNDISKTDVDTAMQKQIGCHNAPYYSSCVDWQHSSRGGYHPYTLEHSGLTFISNMRHHYFRHHYNYAANEGFAGARMRNHFKAAGGGAAAGMGRAEAVSFAASADSSGMAMHGGIAQSSFGDETHLRKYFPETWIWDVKESNENGNLTFLSKVPDTITSWFISAFALGEKLGLGFSVNKTSVTVFQPFFVKATLPYSVIRGETVSIQVTVYNYFKQKTAAKVTLFNEKNELSFAGSNSKESQIISTEIASEDAKTVAFKVTPTKVGYIDIKVSAIGGQAGDIFLDKLLVKPEGETVYVNKALLVNLESSGQTLKNDFNIEIPKEAVEDSERIVFTAIGDILGPAINHLQDLLRMPYGCGEQNMINLVPNILVLDYLTKAGRLTDKIKQKAIEHIETGYQRELTYSHHDGSFSAFGKHDLFGSTWLTAFVTKTFSQMNCYVPFDWHRQHLSANFMRSVQSKDGSFKEHGSVIHKEMQSKSGSNSVSLTAYVTIAIIANSRYFGSYANLVTAKKFLENTIKTTTDVYEVAIVTYALHLLDSNERDFSFKKLMDLHKKEGEFVYWKSSDNYASIEMTSYALMTLLKRRKVNEAVPIVKWLISKQNSRGGYTSTQDTVICLEALAMFAKTVNAANNDIKLEISANGINTQTLQINKENALVLQEVIIPKKNTAVKISATGKGVFVAQLSYKYNVVKQTSKFYFGIKYNISPSNDFTGFHLNVCTKYLQGTASGMAVMQIHFPSGFIIDSDSLNDLKHKLNANGIKRVDVSNANTLLTIYFEKITQNYVCVSISTVREVEVFDLKGAPIIVYDYYDKQKSSTIFYDLIPTKATKPTVTEAKPISTTKTTTPMKPTVQRTKQTVTESTAQSTTQQSKQTTQTVTQSTAQSSTKETSTPATRGTTTSRSRVVIRDD